MGGGPRTAWPLYGPISMRRRNRRYSRTSKSDPKWALMRGMDPEYVCSLIHGRRATDSMATLRPDLDAEKESEILEDIEVEDNEGLVVLPGVLELLAALPEDRWTVVTSASARVARVRLAAARIPVPGEIINAESVGHGKPHPDPYLAGAALDRKST